VPSDPVSPVRHALSKECARFFAGFVLKRVTTFPRIRASVS